MRRFLLFAIVSFFGMSWNSPLTADTGRGFGGVGQCCGCWGTDCDIIGPLNGTGDCGTYPDGGDIPFAFDCSISCDDLCPR